METSTVYICLKIRECHLEAFLFFFPWERCQFWTFWFWFHMEVFAIEADLWSLTFPESCCTRNLSIGIDRPVHCVRCLEDIEKLHYIQYCIPNSSHSITFINVENTYLTPSWILTKKRFLPTSLFTELGARQCFRFATKPTRQRITAFATSDNATNFCLREPRQRDSDNDSRQRTRDMDV